MALESSLRINHIKWSSSSLRKTRRMRRCTCCIKKKWCRTQKDEGGDVSAVSARGSKIGRKIGRSVNERRVVRSSRMQATMDASTKKDKDQNYFLFAGFPLRPFFQRRTIMTEVIKGKIYCFEQPHGLGLSNITVNIRMTVIRMKNGGLFVYLPIAPTKECINMIQNLGEVQHIILPTFAIEHKVFLGPFSRRFPNATIHVAPNTWSWPLNLPFEFLGVFGSKPLSLGNTIESEPWRSEFDYLPFEAQFSDLGPYVEVAFFHKPTKTLLITDAVVFVPKDPPPIVPLEDVLLNARGGGGLKEGKIEIENSRFSRRLGWSRIVMQVLYFGPRDLSLAGWQTRTTPAGFELVSEKLIVSPVVKELVFSEVPDDVHRWIDGICQSWNFERIISAHMHAPIRANGSILRRAFQFAYKNKNRSLNSLRDLIPPWLNTQPLNRFFQIYEGDEHNPDLGALNSLNKILRAVGAK